jgi:hypothetical protein
MIEGGGASVGLMLLTSVMFFFAVVTCCFTVVHFFHSCASFSFALRILEKKRFFASLDLLSRASSFMLDNIVSSRLFCVE